MSEAGLCVVTDPMKSVTKLGRASTAAAAALPPPPLPAGADMLQNGGGAAVEGLKRKYAQALEEQAIQLQTLAQTQTDILHELQTLVQLAAATASTPAQQQHGAGKGIDVGMSG